MPNLAGLGFGYSPGEGNVEPPSPEAGERGFRRKKLATLAGNLYRQGQQAVSDAREQYQQSRFRETGGGDGHGRTHIPGAFPDIAITAQGGDQMVLFPSYAKRHAKQDWNQVQHEQQYGQPDENGGIRDSDYWRQQWDRHEDEKAIVDVDVRGWIYSPHVGPMTRRNRMLIGLARQLSGISAPKNDTAPDSASGAGQPIKSHLQEREERREEEKIKYEAAQIEKRGQKEERAAGRGDYSEKPPEITEIDSGSVYGNLSRRGSQASVSVPNSPTLSATGSSSAGASGQMTDAELAIANANLMARIAPFMTNPFAEHPVTLFFYNDEHSQSKTVHTNDAGHFNMRAPLDFVPTHVRVLAHENLSAIQEIKIIEPSGVSLITDVDDTIKTSNISGGAREIFRNTFIRNLEDLTVDGVKEWYNRMHEMGVSIHYCSNSPWQLYPVLATYFHIVGLPTGSLHLRQYSGMLQGIFEPVAERKKGTLNRLLRDFPDRKFVLVGDSGEADLEVYTDLVMQHPGRVLAVFIRDVTTPEAPGYFDSFKPASRRPSYATLDDARTPRPGQGPKQHSAPESPSQGMRTPTGPSMGTLIDLDDNYQDPSRRPKPATKQLSNGDLLSGKRPPPPRPNKPAALRSQTSPSMDNLPLRSKDDSEKPPPKPPRPGTASHPLSQMHNLSQQGVPTQATFSSEDRGQPPPPPPPRRRGVPSRAPLSPRLRTHHSQNQMRPNSDIDFEPLGQPAIPPPPARPKTQSSRSSLRSGASSPGGSPTLGAVNKKLELWKRRLEVAQEKLEGEGVRLYTWRRGADVQREAEGIVREELERQKRR